MDEKQFTQVIRELRIIKNLLILNALKSGASQNEVGKLMGISGRQIRRILAGRG